jgi:glycosyltransferase involved in cell wall biosynthesis
MKTKTAPSISICLPVYNGQLYLEQAISNALNQTFDDFELLISDDCSVDSSTEIIASLAAQDSRIRHWRNQKNLGLFENYNKCMRQSAGEFIKLYAQDDLWEPVILAREYEILQENKDVALVSCARRIVDEDGQELKIMREHKANARMSHDQVLKENLLQLKNSIGEPSAVMFARRHMGEGFDRTFYHLGDIEYWFRVIGGLKYFYLDEALCAFRTHAASTTSKNAKGLRFALDMVRLGEKYRDFLEKNGVTKEAYSRLVAEATATHLKHLYRKGQTSLSDLLSVKSDSIDLMAQDLDTFKEILFYALLLAAETVEENFALKREWEFERNKLENDVALLIGSRSWRMTDPLRKVQRILKR